jgi:hypothetical protein
VRRGNRIHLHFFAHIEKTARVLRRRAKTRLSGKHIVARIEQPDPRACRAEAQPLIFDGDWRRDIEWRAGLRLGDQQIERIIGRWRRAKAHRASLGNEREPVGQPMFDPRAGLEFPIGRSRDEATVGTIGVARAGKQCGEDQLALALRVSPGARHGQTVGDKAKAQTKTRHCNTHDDTQNHAAKQGLA